MSDRIINYQCPACPNTEFKVLATIAKAKGTKSGRYRCQCTVCDHIEPITGLTPFVSGIEDARDYKDRKVKEEIKKIHDQNENY